MRECIDSGYDGIVIPGFFRKTIPLVNEASKRGISVAVFNCDLSEETSRLAHFSPNVHEAGKLAGELLVRAIGGRGNVIMARGNGDGGVYGARRNAILKVLSKNKKVKLIKEMVTEDDPDMVYKEVKSFISFNNDVQGVYVAGGGIEGAARAVEELGLTGRVKVVGFDHNKEIFEYIKKGIIYAAIGQDPFGQGHDPVVLLYNHIVTGKEVENENMWSRVDVVDQNNVNDLLVM